MEIDEDVDGSNQYFGENKNDDDPLEELALRSISTSL